MSAVRLAITLAGVVMTAARNPAVRAGVRAVASNPKAREKAVMTTRNLAYNAGVLTRHLMGKNKS